MLTYKVCWIFSISSYSIFHFTSFRMVNTDKQSPLRFQCVPFSLKNLIIYHRMEEGEKRIHIQSGNCELVAKDVQCEDEKKYKFSWQRTFDVTCILIYRELNGKPSPPVKIQQFNGYQRSLFSSLDWKLKDVMRLMVSILILLWFGLWDVLLTRSKTAQSRNMIISHIPKS